MVDSYALLGKLGKLQEKHEGIWHGEMEIHIRRRRPTIARIVIRIVIVPHYRADVALEREFIRDIRVGVYWRILGTNHKLGFQLSRPHPFTVSINNNRNPTQRCLPCWPNSSNTQMDHVVVLQVTRTTTTSFHILSSLPYPLLWCIRLGYSTHTTTRRPWYVCSSY